MPDDPVTLTHFPACAKGLALAIALEVAGIEWVWAFPGSSEGDNSKDGGKIQASAAAQAHPMDRQPVQSHTTPIQPPLTLPTLTVPGLGIILSRELVILNYLDKVKPEVRCPFRWDRKQWNLFTVTK